MRQLLNRRVVFFGGKGGVGKTTCSAAFALEAVRQGRRVLLVSTDPAHSLSDIVERPLGGDEREIVPGLTGLEIDAEHEARHYLDEAKSRLTGLFSPAVVREAARQMELAAMMPGLTDVALFERIGEIVRSRAGAFDSVVFDTAPTGHTLRLLQMPELMGGWLEALRARRQTMLDAARPATPDDPRVRPDRPAPGFRGHALTGSTADAAPDPVLRALEERAAKMADVRAQLTSRDVTAIVLVLVPERLPIEETARAAHHLVHAGLDVAAVVVNRVLPDGLGGAFFEARKGQERHYLDEIGRRFSAFRQVRVPQLERDVYGVEPLERIAKLLFT